MTEYGRARFGGKAVVVTGAAGGIGYAVSQAFHAEGATVVMADSDTGRLRTAAAAIDPAGNQVIPVVGDVTSSADCDAMIHTCLTSAGGLDTLVNCAGIVTLGRCVDLPEADWDRVMAVNAKGVFLMMRAALRIMLAGRGGSIVNIASQSGKKGELLSSHYCASKAAVILLTRSVALEVAPTVRVNAVCPGYVDTPMQDYGASAMADLYGGDSAAYLDAWRSEIPLARFQSPDDIARAVLFLASDDASEITGEDLNVSGGLTMY